MKICLLAGAYPPLKCGVGDYTAKLFQSLCDSGEEAMDFEVLTSRDVKTEKADPRIHPCIENWNFRGVMQVVSFLKQHHFDVLHLQYPSVGFQKTLALAFLPLLVRIGLPRVRVFVTLHEFSVSCFLNRLRQLWLVSGSYRTIVTQERERREILEECPWFRRKICVIPIGSSVDRVPLDSGKVQSLEKRFELRDDMPRIAYFGVLHPEKGFEVLLEAAAILKQKGTRIQLVSIGDWDPMNAYHQKLWEKAVALGLDEKDWRQTGYLSTEKVSLLLQTVKACVLPFPDGISLRRSTLLACWLHGVPVVTTECPQPSPDCILHGDTLLMFPSGDVPACVKQIERLLQDPVLQEILRTQGEKIAGRFAWSLIAREHIAVYTFKGKS